MSLHSLAPSAHSTLANDSLLYDDSPVPPLPPLAAPQPRPAHGSYASLHAAAGLGLSHQPTFADDLEKSQDTSNSYLQVGSQYPSQDSSLKERQAYRSTTPVVNGADRFGSTSPSPERNHGYPPNGTLNSPTMSHFSTFEKPSSIRSVRPSGDARHLRSLGFSEQKQDKPPMSRRKKQFITLGIVLGIIAIIAIVVPVIYVVGKNSEKAAAAASSAAAEATATGKAGGTVFPGSGGGNVSEGIDLSAYRSPTNPLNPLASPTSMAVQSGTSGSTVTTYVNGSVVEFTYTNEFGGNYYYDPTNPFSKGGKAQSWSPGIDEEWVWGRDIVRGVNLGGWLVPEPFIGTSSSLILSNQRLTSHYSPVSFRTIPQSRR